MHNPQTTDNSMLLILLLVPLSQQKHENTSEVGATNTEESEEGKKLKHTMDYTSLQCYNYSSCQPLNEEE